MKKIVLIIALTLFVISPSMAQITYFKGTVKEAVEKAKAENKLVIIYASSTS